MGASYILITLIGVVLVIAGAVFLIKGYNSPQRIEDRYAGSDERKNVFIKKYKEADTEYYRGTFLRLGLIGVLMLLIVVFNYSRQDNSQSVTYQLDSEEELVMDIPATQQLKPPPPPPPPPPPQIEVVEDEQVVEEEAVIIDTEVEMDEEVIAEEVVRVEVEVVEEPEPEPEEPEIFSVVEEMPEFPGGQSALLAYLASRIKYPPIARENGIEGTVVVRFVINETGGISNLEVVRDIGGGCGNEAMRVVKGMPKWNPGRQRGQAVRVWFTMPVRFRLS